MKIELEISNYNSIMKVDLEVWYFFILTNIK